MKKLFLLLFSVLSLCMVTSCKESSPVDEEEKTPQIVIQDGVLVAYPAALTQENIRISLPDEVKIIGPNAFKDNYHPQNEAYWNQQNKNILYCIDK